MILKTKKDKNVVTIELLSLNRTRNEKILKTKISMDKHNVNHLSVRCSH